MQHPFDSPTAAVQRMTAQLLLPTLKQLLSLVNQLLMHASGCGALGLLLLLLGVPLAAFSVHPMPYACEQCYERLMLTG